MVRRFCMVIFLVLPFFLYGYEAPVQNDLECKALWKAVLSKKNLDERYKPLVGLCGTQFRAILSKIISTNKLTSYSEARRYLYTQVQSVDGILCDVYSNLCENAMTATTGHQPHMNCEHSWPQSKGAVGVAKSDLHHLFAASTVLNSLRGSYPFCVVVTREASGPVDHDMSALGRAQNGTRCFEPMNKHKGTLARAMFYFSVRYNLDIDAFQEAFFRDWTEVAPVGEVEKERNNKVEAIQNNRNPFIDHPEFIYMISNF